MHKNLKKIYGVPKDKSIILNDAVELDDFKIKPKKPLKTCVYTGSFVQGKGIELIAKIAKLYPKIKFYAYGNIDSLDDIDNFKSIKNLILKKF